MALGRGQRNGHRGWRHLGLRHSDDKVTAFTDFGVENLTELIRMHKDDPELLKRWNR